MKELFYEIRLMMKLIFFVCFDAAYTSPYPFDKWDSSHNYRSRRASQRQLALSHHTTGYAVAVVPLRYIEDQSLRLGSQSRDSKQILYVSKRA